MFVGRADGNAGAVLVCNEQHNKDHGKDSHYRDFAEGGAYESPLAAFRFCFVTGVSAAWFRYHCVGDPLWHEFFGGDCFRYGFGGSFLYCAVLVWADYTKKRPVVGYVELVLKS